MIAGLLTSAQGVLVTLAIGLHNIPEGLAIATVLVARGVSPRQVRHLRYLPCFKHHECTSHELSADAQRQRVVRAHYLGMRQSQLLKQQANRYESH